MKGDRTESETRSRRVFRSKTDDTSVAVCGLHAVDAVFRYKPHIVERLFFDDATGKHLGDVCKFLAQERKPYRQVSRDELVRISDSRHHGGVVAITRRRPLEKVTPKAVSFWAKEGLPLLIMDGVANAHNFGAIVRAGAYFGVEKVLVANTSRQARPNASAYRIARGALDMVDLRLVDNMPVFLKTIRQSHFVIGSNPEGKPFPDLLSLCPDQDAGKPVALVLGNEETGLSDAVADACSEVVSIPGGGAIDCLNVASEAALLLQKYVVDGY